MKLTPFHDNVFVEREAVEEKISPAGIFMPKSAQYEPDTAIVISVGPGRLMSDGTYVVPGVNPGDRVLIGRYSGTEINWGTEKRLIIPWSDILGIVEDDIDVKPIANRSKKSKSKE